MLTRAFAHGFRLDLMAKDVHLALDEARRRGVPMVLGSTVEELWGLADATGDDGRDCTEIVRMFEDVGRRRDRRELMSGGWTLTALRYASRLTTRSDVFLRYGQYREPDGPQEMTYYLWVLRNGEPDDRHRHRVQRGRRGRRGRTFLVEPLQALRRGGIDPAAVGHGHRHAPALRPHRPP